MQQKVFRDAEEFLTLWEVDVSKAGAQDFASLTDLAALMLHYPQYNVSFAQLAQRHMAEARLSPKVYWCRMKRAIRPALEADPATLAALGLPSVGDRRLTCPELSKLLAEVIHAQDDAETAANFADLAAAVARDVWKDAPGVRTNEGTDKR